MRMRKKKNGAKRIENLSALFVNCDAEEINISEIFASSPEKPLRIEIGCGKGDFVCGISVNEPDYNYIALERVGDVIMCAVEKYAVSKGLGKLDDHGGWMTPDGNVYNGEGYDIPTEMRGNVRFVCGEAKQFLAKLPDGCVDSIYTNFSDPWPKKGYTSRRLTHIDFLNEYARVLKDGGMLKLKTDNEGFFDYSLESIEGSSFKIVASTRDLDSDPEFAVGNVETEYERNFKSQGVKIKALRARIDK
ncbi:MAG: tRNA (guanosine(46)-N7)-methyltransferase TrmB [Clostridia bacterium]|nr:tRNA (guanosine(46)-N7)-methyltransferase TrmB [Clostridia bacterium]